MKTHWVRESKAKFILDLGSPLDGVEWLAPRSSDEDPPVRTGRKNSCPCCMANPGRSAGS